MEFGMEFLITCEQASVSASGSESHRSSCIGGVFFPTFFASEANVV